MLNNNRQLIVLDSKIPNELQVFRWMAIGRRRRKRDFIMKNVLRKLFRVGVAQLALMGEPPLLETAKL